jgi:hypothetical protein
MQPSKALQDPSTHSWQDPQSSLVSQARIKGDATARLPKRKVLRAIVRIMTPQEIHLKVSLHTWIDGSVFILI